MRVLQNLTDATAWQAPGANLPSHSYNCHRGFGPKGKGKRAHRSPVRKLRDDHHDRAAGDKDQLIVTYWHKADDSTAPAFVRYWGKADKYERRFRPARSRMTQSGHRAVWTTRAGRPSERLTSAPCASILFASSFKLARVASTQSTIDQAVTRNTSRPGTSV